MSVTRLCTRSEVRNRSAVGRFPDVTLSSVDENDKPESSNLKEGARHGWMRMFCPCCFPRPKHVTDTLGTGIDNVGMDECMTGKKPVTCDTNLEEVLLKVRSIDLIKTQSEENRKEHHTDHYHGDNLIIRRGQTFQMWLDLSHPFNHKNEKIVLHLKIGPQPTVSKGTHIIIPLVDELNDECWEAAIVKQEGTRVKLVVNSSPTTVIGRYQLSVATLCPNGEATYDKTTDIYMLFNPWCEGDTVFMDDEAEINEYVLNDVGKLYYGTENQIGDRTWNYGQFNEGILAACLYVLEKSGTPPSGWGDPVNVARLASAMINSPDDGGVLEGNWSGNYSEGTAPTAWSGSVEILNKYYKAKGVPVKYGQCWVFSGVTTTVLRCLGIPCRSVTNFNSAHDTDVSLTTDVYFDENLEPLNHLNFDSVWNFHVWNDCWMARPDLPEGYGGWQAVDATPQESSQGIYCCGPAPLTAIRDGHVYLKHDCTFVFAEVNSDKMYWQRQTDGTFTQIHCEQNAVGHCISTKAVGSDQRSDITHLYKHPEGTDEERIAVETASRYGTKPKLYSSPTAMDVSIVVQMNGKGPIMGNDVDLNIILRNSSTEQRNISLNSQVAVMYYTGVLKAIVRKDLVEVELLPGEEKTLEWTLLYKDYKDQLVDQCAMMLTLAGRVQQTQQVLATQFCFRLRTPDLIIKPIGEAVVGEKMTVVISFTNPLPRLLKGVVIRIEGVGLLNIQKITVGDIGSLASMTLTEHLAPMLAGPRKLLAALDCKQLTQVHGVADIIVKEKGSDS